MCEEKDVEEIVSTSIHRKYQHRSCYENQILQTATNYILIDTSWLFFSFLMFDAVKPFVLTRLLSTRPRTTPNLTSWTHLRQRKRNAVKFAFIKSALTLQFVCTEGSLHLWNTNDSSSLSVTHDRRVTWFTGASLCWSPKFHVKKRGQWDQFLARPRP